MALNGSWDVNYGLHAQQNGRIPLATSASPQAVAFYYDHKTHWVTENVSSIIATVPGSFQSELGCSGDWDPGCFRSWLQDIQGSGVYSFSTSSIPAGSYEGKVALNGSWDVNYGAGRRADGPTSHSPCRPTAWTSSFNGTRDQGLRVIVGGIHGDLSKARPTGFGRHHRLECSNRYRGHAVRGSGGALTLDGPGVIAGAQSQILDAGA